MDWVKPLANSRWVRAILRRVGRDSRGAEIVEAAIVMPLMFMFLLGIFWFGRAYNIYATINHAAREGARIGVAPTCATCGNVETSADAIAARVGLALQASSLRPARVTSSAPLMCACGTTTCNTSVACETVTGNPQICVQKDVSLTTGPPNSCGTVVSFQYPLADWENPGPWFIPFTSVNLQQINLHAQVQMRNDK